MWLLAKAYRVTQLCDLPDFPSKAIGCGKQGGDGEGRVDNQKDYSQISDYQKHLVAS